VATGATDMRKGFDGLYGRVRDELGCDPLSGHLFLFANARRTAGEAEMLADDEASNAMEIQRVIERVIECR